MGTYAIQARRALDDTGLFCYVKPGLSADDRPRHGCYTFGQGPGEGDAQPGKVSTGPPEAPSLSEMDLECE